MKKTAAPQKRKTSLALPDGLWRRLRIRSLEVGRDAQDIVAELIEEYLERKVERSERVRRVRPLAEIERQLRKKGGKRAR